MKHATVRRSLIAMLSVASLLAAPSVMAITLSSGQDLATLSPAPQAAYVDFGALYVNGAMTLDASTPIFHFTTLEMAAGSTLSFSNLMRATPCSSSPVRRSAYTANCSSRQPLASISKHRCWNWARSV